jgi:hypothetical protein
MLKIIDHKGNVKQATLRFFLTPVTIAIINSITPNADLDVEKKTTSARLVGI